MQTYARFDQLGQHARLFERVAHPFGKGRHGRDQLDPHPARGEVRRQRIGKVVVVVVVDHHPRPRRQLGTTAEQVIGRQRRPCKAVDRCAVGPAPAGAQPARAGCDQNMVSREFGDGLSSHGRLCEQGYVLHASELIQAVVGNPAPGRMVAQAAFVPDPSAKVRACLRQCHPMPAPSERQRGFQTGRAAADDQHLSPVGKHRHTLGVPAPAPFLGDRRVLGAAHDHACVFDRHTDVAADALADVLDPPLTDLVGQEGIGDRRPGAADDIEHPAPQLADHGIGRGKAPHAQNRLVRDLLDEAGEGFLKALGVVARRAAVALPT